MSIIYYRNSSNNYIGAFEGGVPVGGLEVPSAPQNAAATWNGSAWVEPTIVPAEVTRRQAKRALLAAGHLAAVETALNNISDADAKAAALIDWREAGTFSRTNGIVILMISALSLTDAQTDALFVSAATYT